MTAWCKWCRHIVDVEELYTIAYLRCTECGSVWPKPHNFGETP